MTFCISPAVRRLRYHDPDLATGTEDIFVMHVTPSVTDNDFHRFLTKAHSTMGVVAPNETREFTFDAKRGYHDVFAPSVHALTYLIAREEGATEVNLELFDGQLLPEQVQVKVGPVKVRLNNKTELRLPIWVGFLGDDNDEHAAPNYTILRFLTGKRVLTSQTFRRLFKAETLDVGTGLQLKNLAVLFTDLQASTLMYERVGDLKALDIVRRHFDVLEEVVARHQGAVVKTIGDAVMAVFPESSKAMLAAAEMIDTVRRATAHGEDLVLKIGLHCGPCVAIQSNNQVDYFGRTVNIASRVQALAEGGQIVCTDDVWNQPGVAEVVAARGFSSKREQPFLKGIADRFPVRRVVVANVVAFARPRPAAKRAAPVRKAASSSKRAARAKPARAKSTRAAPARAKRAAPARRARR